MGGAERVERGREGTRGYVGGERRWAGWFSAHYLSLQNQGFPLHISRKLLPNPVVLAGKTNHSITLSFLLRPPDFISMSQFVSDFIKYLDVLRNSVCPTSLAAGFVPP